MGLATPRSGLGSASFRRGVHFRHPSLAAFGRHYRYPLAGIAASVTEALFTSTKAFTILSSKTQVPPNISEGAYAAEV